MVNKKNISTLRSNTRKRKNILYDSRNEFMNRGQISPQFEYNILSNYSISPESPVQSVFDKDRSPTYLSDSEYVDSDSDNDERESRENIGNENKIESDDLSYASITSKNDMKIYRMKCLLDDKRKSIIKKNKEIKELSKQNAYLESIITDYDNLNTNNLDEKQKQKKALKILSEHIRDISKDLKKDKHEIHRVKNDQKMIMAEIEKLRNEMSDILNATDIPGKLYASSDSDSYNTE